MTADEMSSPPRIEIDPNVRTSGNQTFRARAGTPDLPVGAAVVLYEPEEGVEWGGLVSGICLGPDLVCYSVNWASGRPIRDVWDDPMSTIASDDSLKMIRETLCVAQTHVGLSADPRKREHVERLQRLIDDIDRQRPLGPDGKHGDRHTADCGCEDVDDR